MAEVGKLTVPDTTPSVSVVLSFLDDKGQAADPKAVAALTNVVGVLPDGSSLGFALGPDGAWAVNEGLPGTVGPIVVAVQATNPDGSEARGSYEIDVTGGAPTQIVATLTANP